MFGDVERSPTWAGTPTMMTPTLPSSAISTPVLGPSAHHPLMSSPHVLTPSSTTSQARPPVQSGWFPLQDVVGHAPSPLNMGTSLHRLSVSGNEQPQQHMPWPQDPGQTMNGGMPVYPHPTPSNGSHAGSGIYTTTPIQSVGPSYGWPETRLHPPAPLNTPIMDPIGHHGNPHHLPPPLDDMHMHRGHPHMTAMSSSPMLMGFPTRHSGFHGGYGASPRKKNQREISIGRWTSDEHRVFLRGLETYQGPAWGEIAKMIGTRTSTQVRTHAQKFFTKLARTNQILPHFEAQIQKERARLISQGAIVATGPSVTPTSINTHAFTFSSTLSPPPKRGAMSPRQAAGKRDDPSHSLFTGGGYYPSTDPTYARGMGGGFVEDHGNSAHVLRPPTTTTASSGYYNNASTLHQPEYTPDHPSPMLGYTTEPATTTAAASSCFRQQHHGGAGEWGSDRSWAAPTSALMDPTPPVVHAVDPSHPTSSHDLDSLPSVTKLLYRGSI